MWATISILGLLFMQPTDPGKANPRTVVQLQQFSWTEGTLDDCIKVWPEGQPGKGTTPSPQSRIWLAWQHTLLAVLCFERAPTDQTRRSSVA